MAQSQTAVLGRFRCRQQLRHAALRQEASVQIGRIYTCRLPGKGIQRGGLCTHQQLGRGNRCHRHRPHEALCMGQVLQGFGKKKKNRHRAKETRQTTFQAEGTESAGTVLEEHGAYPKKKLHIRIPQRQFMGESEELNRRIRERWTRKLPTF